MGRIAEVISGIGLLIGLYLVLSHAGNASKVVSQLGSSSSTVIKTLQGR